jgi:hypothetical protein
MQVLPRCVHGSTVGLVAMVSVSIVQRMGGPAGFPSRAAGLGGVRRVHLSRRSAGGVGVRWRRPTRRVTATPHADSPQRQAPSGWSAIVPPRAPGLCTCWPGGLNRRAGRRARCERVDSGQSVAATTDLPIVVRIWRSRTAGAGTGGRAARGRCHRRQRPGPADRRGLCRLRRRRVPGDVFTERRLHRARDAAATAQGRLQAIQRTIKHGEPLDPRSRTSSPRDEGLGDRARRDALHPLVPAAHGA